MRRDVIKGNTPEQKLKSAEAAVRRLQRKNFNARVSSFITPFPVSSFVKTIPEDGVVLRYMFPGDGRITNACLQVEGDLKQGVIATAHAKGQSGMGSGISIEFRKHFTKFFMDMYIGAGDMLSIHISPDSGLVNIWTAFLWLPEVGEVDVKSFLVRELAKLEEAQDEGA